MATQDTILSNLAALGFDNSSNAALFRKIAEALGITVDNTLTEFANTETNITNIINTQRYGKENWYVDKALAFQFGDDLVEDPTTLDYVYAILDDTKQVVKQAAFENLSAQLFLKVAGLDAAGNTIKLPNDEFLAFQSYMLNFEIPGIPVSMITNDPNILFANFLCTYYPTYDLSTLKTNLIAAMTTFRQSFTFNGVFFCGDMEAYIKANVAGIRDFFVYNTMIDNVPFSGSTTLAAGYFNYTNNYQDNINYQSAS